MLAEAWEALDYDKMKKSYLFIALLFGAVNCIGQIRLSQADYPVLATEVDSVRLTTWSSAFPVLSPAASGTFDLTIVTDSLPMQPRHRKYTAAYYFYDSSFQVSYFGLGVNVNREFSNSPYELAEHESKSFDTSYDIFLRTSSITDSLFFPTQDMLYVGQAKKLAFPCTYGSSWTSDYVRDFRFELSYGIYACNHAPGIVRSTISETDSVTGWGAMRINDIAGNPSPYWSVLQVQSVVVRRDSFLLNGGYMPNAILTAFGLTQGQTDTVFEQYYYRKGEITPLAHVLFRDRTFATPYRAETHVQRLSKLAIPENEQETDGKIFPNPVIGNQTIVALNKANGSCSYSLRTGQGIVVHRGQLNFSNHQAVLPLPADIANGIYYLHCVIPGAGEVTLPLEINR